MDNKISLNKVKELEENSKDAYDYYKVLLDYFKSCERTLHQKRKQLVYCEIEAIYEIADFVREYFDFSLLLKHKLLDQLHSIFCLHQSYCNKKVSYHSYKKQTKSRSIPFQALYDYTKFNMKKTKQFFDLEILYNLKERFIPNTFINKFYSILKKYRIDNSDILDFVEAREFDNVLSHLKKIIIFNRLKKMEDEILKQCANLSPDKIDKYLRKLSEIEPEYFNFQSYKKFKYIVYLLIDNDAIDKFACDKKGVSLLKKASRLLREKRNGVSVNIIARENIMKDNKSLQSVYFPKIGTIKNERLSLEEDKYIISVDQTRKTKQDGAFSIKEDDGGYVLDVYITDIPSFLKNHKNIARLAYEVGEKTFYSEKSGLRNLNLFPNILCNKFFKLSKNTLRNVIAFTFFISSSGEIEIVNVDRKKILVSDNLSFEVSKKVLNRQDSNSKLYNFFSLYQEACKKIIFSSSYNFLKCIDVEDINSLVSICSVLVNYYVGKTNDFAIYRENSTYVREPIQEKYAQATAPMRMFVSDINLAFLLYQKGLTYFDERDLYQIEENQDAIIKHLNYRYALARELEKEGLRKDK